MIEKHVKFSGVDCMHFDKVALDLATNEFSNFLADICSAERNLGFPAKQILECERRKYPAN